MGYPGPSTRIVCACGCSSHPLWVKVCQVGEVWQGGCAYICISIYIYIYIYGLSRAERTRILSARVGFRTILGG